MLWMTLTQASENLVNTFERKVLRWIIGAKRETQHKLYQIFVDPESSKLENLQQLQWIGHIQRVDLKADT